MTLNRSISADFASIERAEASFDDLTTVAEIVQACATIRKAMLQINELHKKKDTTALDFNQMTRWVNTKEGRHRINTKNINY